MQSILAESLLHCHVKNVHSIMLINHPGKTLRLFIAEPGNALIDNHPKSENPLSIAFHPHHCNVTLHVVKGVLGNWIIQPNRGSRERHGRPYNKFRYKSGIHFNKAGFKRLESARVKTFSVKEISRGESFSLLSWMPHTVYCSADEFTAWFVYEGKEDSDYDNLCWSDNNLENIDMSGLYQKFQSEHELRYFLFKASLI